MRKTIFVSAILATAVFGCRRDAVTTYEAPKESNAPVAVAAPSSSTPEPDRASQNTSPNSPPWVVPAGWQTKPGDGMRIASYGVTSSDGRAVDISVIALNGQAGSELDNVNRWRSEVSLGPITEAELVGSRSTVQVGSRTGALYEFKGDKPSIDGKYKASTEVAVLPAGDLTVYFKMKGERDLVVEQKPKYLEWLKSIRTDEGSNANAAPPAQAAGSATAMQGQVTPPPATDVPEWQPPKHWRETGPKPMRLTSFEIPNTAGAPGDVSVSALGGPAGGLLANVNRWRNQVHLPPIEDEGSLATMGQKVDLAGGASGTLVDLKGTPDRILAIVVPRGDRTWFFKLKADDALVTKERDGFVQFVKSVKF